jgi:hypothetical protein
VLAGTANDDLVGGHAVANANRIGTDANACSV